MPKPKLVVVNQQDAQKPVSDLSGEAAYFAYPTSRIAAKTLVSVEHVEREHAVAKAPLPPGNIECTMADGDPLLIPTVLIGLVYPNKNGTTIEVGAEAAAYEVKEDYETVKLMMYNAR